MTTRSEATRAMRGSGLHWGARLAFWMLAASDRSEDLEIAEESSPSLAELVEWTGLGKSTLTGHLNTLEKHGWLHRTRGTGGRRTLYRLDIGECLPSKPKPRPRPRISPRVRLAVYKRDRYACVRCASNEDLTLDHIIPWSKGGDTAAENLQTLCRSCNSSKGDR